MMRRKDDKTLANRLAFASLWLGMVALCLCFWIWFVG